MSETSGPAWPTDADLHQRLRRACAEADGFRYEDLEPHDYQKHASNLLEVIPAVEQYYAALRDRADAVAQELHRRLSRLRDLRDDPESSEIALAQVSGETIGLRGALGIFLVPPRRPASIPFSDHVGENHYRNWLRDRCAEGASSEEAVTEATHGTGLRLTTAERVADVVGPNTELLCEENARLRAEVAAAREFAADMRDFCSPHGVAADYADQLIEDRAKTSGADGREQG